MELEGENAQPSLSAIGRRIHQRLVALEPYDKLTIQVQRYDLWAENLGVYHLGHSSLDYRFRDAPSIHRLTHRLLSHLEETLLTVEEVASQGDFGLPRNTVSLVDPADAGRTDDGNETEGSVDSLDSDEKEMLASYDDESLSDITLVRLESIIDRLYRLSFRIRNPATRLGTTKASRYRDIDKDTGIDLIEMLAEADRRHIQELLKQMSGASVEDYNDHYLVSRLSQANTLRRKQFGQWRRHRKKLEGLSQHKQDLPLEKPIGGSRAQPPIAHGNNSGTLLSTGDKEPSRPSTATRIADRHLDLDDNRSIVSTSTYAQLHDADATKVLMPPPPNIPRHMKEFECPYCCILCSRKTFEKRTWEHHIMKDLRPYTCTFEGCDTGSQLYDSLNDWRGHETQVHEADPNQRRCPFCFVDASGQHIAGHLRQVALFALPRSAYLENDSDEGGSANAQLDLGSRDSNLSSLALSLLHESSDEIDVTEVQMPSTELTNHALQELPGKTKLDLFDYLRSDAFYEADVNGGNKESDTLQTASQKDHTQLVKEAKTLLVRAMDRWKRKMKELEEAEKQEVGVMETRKRILGEEHQDTLISMATVAMIYRRQGRWEEAEELQTRVMEIEKKVLGEEHPDTLISIDALARTYKAQGRWAEAAKLELRIVKPRKTSSPSQSSSAELPVTHWLPKVFEQSHPTTVFSDSSEQLAPSGSDCKLVLKIPRSICLGKLMPGAATRLSEEYEKLLEMPFDRGNLLVGLYVRSADQRARIHCQTIRRFWSRGESCEPLTSLRIQRVASCLQLSVMDSSGRAASMWANLRFTNYEELVLFHCTFLALKAEDGKTPTETVDDELLGEEKHFSGLIVDDHYEHVLRVFQDQDSGGIRLLASIRGGELRRTPVWTAFINHHLVSPTWMRKDPHSPKTVYLADLQLYIFTDQYTPQLGPDGAQELRFHPTDYADTFTETIKHLAGLQHERSDQ